MVLGWLKGFFSLKKGYDEVLVQSDVIQNIIEIARTTHPLEFIALLRGEVRDRKLVIDSLIYQNYRASSESAMMDIDLPLLSGVAGSVHSHPGPSNRPSGTDLQFFNKRGGVNLIICAPYTLRTIAAYNANGGFIPVRVVVG